MSLPVIDDAYIQSVYARLQTMTVELDGDPLIYGPKRLNGKIAACRRHLSTCQQISLQLSNDCQRFQRAHRRAKLDYDLTLQDMLANDAQVRSGNNIRDREAIANSRLRAERETISDLEAAVEDVKAIIQIVKSKREDLRDIQGRLKDQLKLCQEEINLGSRWGSSPPPEAGHVEVNPTIDVDLHKLMELHEIGSFDAGELDAAVLVASAPATLVDTLAPTEDVDAFLDELEVSTPASSVSSVEEIDFDDFLEGLG